MTFEELRPEQQQAVLAFMLQFRPIVGENARALRALQGLVAVWGAAAGPLIAQLDPSAIIPDSTGLAGAQPLTAADVSGMMAGNKQAIDAFYQADNLMQFVKIVGSGNV